MPFVQGQGQVKIALRPERLAQLVEIRCQFATPSKRLTFIQVFKVLSDFSPLLERNLVKRVEVINSRLVSIVPLKVQRIASDRLRVHGANLRTDGRFGKRSFSRMLVDATRARTIVAKLHVRYREALSCIPFDEHLRGTEWIHFFWNRLHG